MCHVCETEFMVLPSSKQKTCSRKCADESKHNVGKCVCGTKFVRRNPNHRFCSSDCSASQKRKRISLACQHCHRRFEVPASRSSRQFCSKLCRDESQRTPFNSAFFDEETPEVAYWAGFLMADGGVRWNKTSCKLTLGLSIKDLDQLVSFKEAISAEIEDFNYQTNELGSSANFAVSHPRIKESLKRWGIVPNKTSVGEIPCDIPQKLLPHYLRGLFDGDGSLSDADSGHYQVHLTNNFSICSGVSRILEEQIGIPGRVVLKKENSKTGHKTYRWLVSSAEEVKPIVNWLYASDEPAMGRKKERALAMLGR